MGLMLLKLDDFKIYHSELVCCCQLLENDLKWIYSFITGCNIQQTRDSLDKANMGRVIKILKKIDIKGNKNIFSDEDYEYLLEIKDIRNYWCHQCYIDFLYKNNFRYTEEYSNASTRLISDHKRLHYVYKIVENIKLNLAKNNK